MFAPQTLAYAVLGAWPSSRELPVSCSGMDKKNLLQRFCLVRLMHHIWPQLEMINQNQPSGFHGNVPFGTKVRVSVTTATSNLLFFPLLSLCQSFCFPPSFITWVWRRTFTSGPSQRFGPTTLLLRPVGSDPRRPLSDATGTTHLTDQLLIQVNRNELTGRASAS